MKRRKLPARWRLTLKARLSRKAPNLLQRWVSSLTKPIRAPLILCCLEGLSQEEAARRLGCSPAAVRGRLERVGIRDVAASTVFLLCNRRDWRRLCVQRIDRFRTEMVS